VLAVHDDLASSASDEHDAQRRLPRDPPPHRDLASGPDVGIFEQRPDRLARARELDLEAEVDLSR
jgi:hypothetical protein